MQKARVALVAIVSVLMAALRTFIIAYRMEKNEVDNETYYLPETNEVTAFAVVCAVLAVLFFVIAYMNCKKKNVDLRHSFGSVPAGSLVLAFSLVFAAYVYAASAFFGSEASYTVIGVLIFVFTLLSAVKFYFSGLFYKSERNKTLQAFAAMAPIFLAVFRLLGDFIRKSAAPFASSGAYQLLGLIAVMLFFLFEGKSYVSTVSSAGYHFFGYTAILFLLVYSLPNLVLHCFGAFCFDYYTAYSVADLGTVVYIAARLSSAKQTVKE